MFATSFIDMVLHFKTKKCMDHHPINENETCFFYHDDSDLRRELLSSDAKGLAYHHILFLPTMIPETQRSTFCQNLPEYSYHILNYKTKPCPYLAVEKSCAREKFCPYIHPGDDLASLIEYRKKYISPPLLPAHKVFPDISYSTQAMSKDLKTHPAYLYPISENETAYVYGAQVDFQEDIEHEFKAWTFSKNFDWLMDCLQEYICAFANTNGGTIYVGIADDGCVQGAVCDRAVKDRVRLTIDSIVLRFCYNVVLTELTIIEDEL